MKRIFTFFFAMLIVLCSVISVNAVEDTTEEITESITEAFTEVTTESLTEIVTEEPTEDLIEKSVNIAEYQYSIMLIVLVILIFGLCVLLVK